MKRKLAAAPAAAMMLGTNRARGHCGGAGRRDCGQRRREFSTGDSCTVGEVSASLLKLNELLKK